MSTHEEAGNLLLGAPDVAEPSSGRRLPRSIYVSLLLAPIAVFGIVYAIARCIGLPFGPDQLTVGLLALAGVLLTSTLSSILAVHTLLETRHKGSKDREGARELAAEKAVHESELAQALRQHTQALAEQKEEHDKELAALQYSYSLRREVDQREYNDLVDRINQISRAAVNANELVQKLSRLAPGMQPEHVIENTGQIFVTVAPLYASPAGGSRVLPSTLAELLGGLRSNFTKVFLALSEEPPARDDKYLRELKSKLSALDAEVKNFASKVGPAKAELRREMAALDSNEIVPVDVLKDSGQHAPMQPGA